MLGRAIVSVGTVVLLALPGVAQADPFNVWGARTERGTLGFNPYWSYGRSERGSGSMYAMWGMAGWLDVVVGGTVPIGEGAPLPPSFELLPRIFPSKDVDLAIAGHLYVEEGYWELAPELHLAGYATDALGIWVNAGARYELGAPAQPATFAWFGVELTDEHAFVAFELDLEATESVRAEITAIPSVGVWLGREGQTGVSLGWFLPVGGEVGIGGWFWRTVDLKGQGRKRRKPAFPDL